MGMVSIDFKRIFKKKIDISKKLSNLGIKLKFVLFSTFSLKNRLKCSTLAAAPSTSYT